MRFARVFCVFSVLAMASFQMKAQGFTAINFHLPFPVLAGTQELAPGDYTIRPVSTTSDVFAIYADGGMKGATFVRAIPVEKVTPPNKTSLVVQSDGREYVIDQMWIEGLGTGYQFIVPESVQSREREQSPSEIPANKGSQ